ncbi:hypothetical protein SRHO_G00295280 [Serrasalmus rhombeus]
MFCFSSSSKGLLADDSTEPRPCGLRNFPHARKEALRFCLRCRSAAAAASNFRTSANLLPLEWTVRTQCVFVWTV